MSRKARNDFVTKLLVDEGKEDSKKIRYFYSVITCYIDKISSPVLDDVFKAREALRYLYSASECSRPQKPTH